MNPLAILLAGVAGLLSVGCVRAGKPPDIVLIVVDTLRADALGCYGAPGSSPAIDQIASEGVRFEHVVAQAPWTYPSLASILTSQYPYEHGMGVAVRGVRRGATRALPTTLQAHGYRTAAFSELECSLLQRANFDYCHFPESYARADENFSTELTFSAARRWLQTNNHKPFFLMIHTYEVHDYFTARPYARERAVRSLPGYDGRFREWSIRGSDSPALGIVDSLLGASPADMAFVRALYQAAVTRVDEEIGALDRLLASLSLQDDTVLVVTSDHGEGFDPRLRRLHHGGRLHEDLLHVPLIIRWKGHIAPAIVKDVVESIDIAPTLLALLQVRPEVTHRGKALLALAATGSPRSAGFVPRPRSSPRAFSEESAFLVEASGRRVLASTRQFAVYSPPYKLTDAGGRLELYDLARDPLETLNLADSRPETARTLLAVAEGSLGSVTLDPAARKETEDALRGLGYIR